MHKVFIDNQAVKVKTSDMIGEGGEAEVFRLDPTTALKLFKPPSHPQFQQAGTTDLVEARHKEYQTKLTQFPKVTSPYVVTPLECAYNKPDPSGRVIGYAMQLISPACSLREYSQREFRETGGISSRDVVELFIQIHHTLTQVHRQSIVVGDLNQLNVLVKDNQPYLIDADSMQFDAFYCRSFSPKYSDPLALQISGGALNMVQNHSTETDWYSFAVLLFECMLYVHPYGGVYKPGDPKCKLSLDERLLKRVSVFHRDVKYPLAGEPISSLTAPLKEYFYELFVNDVRKPVPLELLESIVSQGTIISSSSKTGVSDDSTPRQNPSRITSPAKPQEVFRTDGVILKTAFDGKQLRYLYFTDGHFCREDGKTVLRGTLDPGLRFALHGSKTICGKNSRVYVLDNEKGSVKLSVELFRGKQPVFDANEEHCFYVDHGQLFCQSDGQPKFIEEVLSNQTLLWMGTEFGFGLVTAGEFKRAFLFDSNPGRILVDEELFPGPPIEIMCSFTHDRVWILSSSHGAGRIKNRCSLLDMRGRLLASREDQEGTGSWQDFQRSGCAAALSTKAGRTVEALLVATNNGVAVIEEVSGRLQVVRTIAEIDTKDLAGCHLLYSPTGLYLCSSTRISHINTQAIQG